MINEGKGSDVVINFKTDDYIITGSVIDPITNQSVNAYIIKENVPIYFSFANKDISTNGGSVTNIYYRKYKGKNITIRSRDFSYIPTNEFMVIHEDTYDILKATNRLYDSVFKYIVKYNVENSGETTESEITFYFRVVSESDYTDYKKAYEATFKPETGTEIKRPKKQEN